MGILTSMGTWKVVGLVAGGALAGAVGVVALLYAWLWKAGWR